MQGACASEAWLKEQYQKDAQNPSSPQQADANKAETTEAVDDYTVRS